MNKELKKVLDKLVSDEAFAEKMTQCKSPDEAYELARTVADGYTQEEFQAMMAEMKAIAAKHSEAGEEAELTEADLRTVAGGAWDAESEAVLGFAVATCAFGATAAGSAI